MKIILTLFVAVSLYANDSLIKFYHTALTNLQYDKKYVSLQKGEESSKKALSWQRFGNFSMDLGHTKTKAAKLTNSFDTTDLSFNDTLDIFGKESYQYDAISLQYKEQKTLLKKQKEELFISLVSMISAYQQTKQIHKLHSDLFMQQKEMFERLSALKESVSTMDLLRFQNSLTLFESQLIDEEHQIKMMADQLQNYVPQTLVPELKEEQAAYNLASYLDADTDIKLNHIASRRLENEAKGLKSSFLPTLNAAATYQNINDPTANGDNYAFTLALNIPLDASVSYQNEVLRSQSLRLHDDVATLQIKRKNEFVQRVNSINNDTQQLSLLQKNLKDYQQSDSVIQKAFLKHYVDFNTYIQTHSQALSVQEQIIKLTQEKQRETAILNGICTGDIYE